MRLSLTIRSIAIAVLAVVAQSAHAEDDQRLSSIESRLAMIESTPTPLASGACKSCPINSSRISTNSLGCPTTYAGFELAILKPHTGSLGGSIDPLNLSGSLTSTFDADVAPRIYLGREGARGLGVRGTYFTLDHDSDPSALGITTSLELDTLDLELTNRLRFCGSDFMLSAGFRYAKLQQDYTIQGLGSLGWESEGGGMTIGGQMRRGIGQSRWNLLISGRASLLLTDNELAIPGLISVVGEDSTMKIWELRLGVNRNFHLDCGANVVSEFALETQNWDSAPIAGLVGNDISLFGPVFRIGLNY